MSKEKYIEILKKVKALADKGVGGEKASAEKILKELMDKYGISMDALDDTQLHEVYFKAKRGYGRKGFQLLSQIIYSVVGKDREFFSSGKSTKGIFGQFTWGEAVEIRAKYEYYWSAFKRRYETFYTAFVQKNQLFPANSDDNNYREPTKEDYEAMRLANSLESDRYFKQLNNNKRVDHDR